jgi:uncharacterized protein
MQGIRCVFALILPEGFATSPWKNGGGVTHEVARAEGPKGWLWRLSIAEVASDGPFSRFEGLTRILTVISGAGLDLHLPDQVLAARPLQPTVFSGDTPVESRMLAGPIRDFNVIYDADLIEASVEVIGPGQYSLAQGGVLHLAGPISVADQMLAPGAFALGSGEVRLGQGATALLVRLAPREGSA